MPAADAVLLPLAAGLTLLGVLVAVIAGRRGRRGRMVQGIALALLPVALYLSGLLTLVWDFVVSVVGWASRVVFTPVVWAGLGLLGLAVVLWVVGGVVAARTPRPAKGSMGSGPKASGAAAKGGATTGPTAPATPAVGRGPQPPKTQGKAAPAQDDDMAEIEALLKSRGIE